MSQNETSPSDTGPGDTFKCKKCGDVIESTYRHDFKFCKCGAVAVDGGKDYLRRIGYEEDYEELSEVEKEDKKDE